MQRRQQNSVLKFCTNNCMSLCYESAGLLPTHRKQYRLCASASNILAFWILISPSLASRGMSVYCKLHGANLLQVIRCFALYTEERFAKCHRVVPHCPEAT